VRYNDTYLSSFFNLFGVRPLPLYSLHDLIVLRKESKASAESQYSPSHTLNSTPLDSSSEEGIEVNHHSAVSKMK
jgi:hypothetical protein